MINGFIQQPNWSIDKNNRRLRSTICSWLLNKISLICFWLYFVYSWWIRTESTQVKSIDKLRPNMITDFVVLRQHGLLNTVGNLDQITEDCSRMIRDNSANKPRPFASQMQTDPVCIWLVMKTRESTEQLNVQLPYSSVQPDELYLNARYPGKLTITTVSAVATLKTIRTVNDLIMTCRFGSEPSDKQWPISW